ncbi:hypothetical protein IEQ34_015862 [Dendrobium chrysotoxum]|uniref:VWFA domain-containing protein n=1 Tax=Dendrobium chrysotoxum TaxID=161865 RepID=A0AAV7GHZ8_DENCH|nr:hypothetical protein IEQ34_015862 [Dendrobium chrysotoxum]
MEEFTMSVEEGLRLAKRVSAGKDRYTEAPPRQQAEMERSRASLIPKAPMLYAVIVDPAIVDNPDIPSYQPHVYGRCDPPALIPLHMKEIAVKTDCYLDTALISVRGRWRLHCVMSSRRCDCRLVVPFGEQGSILGVEVNFARKSYFTQVVHREVDQNKERFIKNEHKGFLKPTIFSLMIPQVFSNDIYGGILLNSPSMHDLDQRNMFCLCLYPGSNPMGKVFRKEVIFLVDISGSMQGKPLESVKSALLSILPELAPTDCFNIIAFNEEMYSFSSFLEPANVHIATIISCKCCHPLVEVNMVLHMIKPEMQKWFRKALFPVLTNITVDAFDDLKAFEVYPWKLPDLLIECPLIISGRYEGKFPNTVKVEGRSADMNEVVVNLKVQNSTDIPIEKVFVKQQIDLLTAQAWFFESMQLEEKVAKLSIQWGIPSEYTVMIVRIEAVEQDMMKKKQDETRHNKAIDEAVTLVHYVTVGFGNQIATLENLPPGCEEPRDPNAFAALGKAVSCCSGFCDCFCCFCLIKTCSKMSDQCLIALTQLCSALSCFACSECCVQHKNFNFYIKKLKNIIKILIFFKFILNVKNLLFPKKNLR